LKKKRDREKGQVVRIVVSEGEKVTSKGKKGSVNENGLRDGRKEEATCPKSSSWSS
jgi:hypothetical protein